MPHRLVHGLAVHGQSWDVYQAQLPLIRGLLGLIDAEWLIDR